MFFSDSAEQMVILLRWVEAAKFPEMLVTQIKVRGCEPSAVLGWAVSPGGSEATQITSHYVWSVLRKSVV